MSLTIIILAAGQGKRMKSRLPKVLHKLAGRTLLEHVHVASLLLQSGNTFVVYGHGGEQVKETLNHLPVKWVEQAEQLGTGHAVQQVIDAIPDADNVLILYGDVPLITYQTLSRLVESAAQSGFSLLTSELEDPSGYGRIVRNAAGHIQCIVEDKDATPDQRAICEINTGMMTVRADRLKTW